MSRTSSILKLCAPAPLRDKVTRSFIPGAIQLPTATADCYCHSILLRLRGLQMDHDVIDELIRVHDRPFDFVAQSMAFDNGHQG